MPTDRIEDDALAQGPLADRQLVDVEEVHRGREELGPGDDELDSLGVESLDLLALRGRRFEQLAVQRLELLAREAELVERTGDRLVASGGDHLGEIFERATAADRQLGLELRDLDREWAEDVDEVLAQPATITLGDGIGAHELRAEPRDAEPLACGPLQAGRVAHHDLDAPATEVEAQRGARVDQHRGADRGEDQAGFLEPVDDVRGDAGLRLDAIEHRVTVGGAPQRARGAARAPRSRRLPRRAGGTGAWSGPRRPPRQT